MRGAPLRCWGQGGGLHVFVVVLFRLLDLLDLLVVLLDPWGRLVGHEVEVDRGEALRGGREPYAEHFWHGG